METSTRLCPFCEACRGLVVSYEPDTRRIVSIKEDKDNPFSQGYLCPKSQALKLLEDDTDRLTRPLVREKGGFVETDYDMALDRGARPEGLTLARLKTYPHGVDFGPMVEQLQSFLCTADKRIRLTPEIIVKDLDRLAAELPALEKDSRLSLVGRRHLRSNNSWTHIVSALGKGPDRTRGLIHPDDATAHGLDEDGVAKISTPSGEIAVQI